MKHFLLFVVMMAFSLVSFSQSDWLGVGNKAGSGKNIYSIKRNAVYAEDLLLYNYERLLPFSEKMALGLKGGLMIQSSSMFLTEASFIGGGPRNFFEAGAGIMFSIGTGIQDSFFEQGLLDDLEEGAYFTLRTGYRYQAHRGFLLKVGAIYSPGNFTLPLIGFGYAF